MKTILALVVLFIGCATAITDAPKLSFRGIPQELEAKKLEAQDLAVQVFNSPACLQKFSQLPDFPPGEIRNELVWNNYTSSTALATTYHNGKFYWIVVPVTSVEKMTVEELAIVYLHEAFHKADWPNVDFSDRRSIVSAEARAVYVSHWCFYKFKGYPETFSIPGFSASRLELLKEMAEIE